MKDISSIRLLRASIASYFAFSSSHSATSKNLATSPPCVIDSPGLYLPFTRPLIKPPTMQTDILTNISSWAIAFLAFPGLLFALVLALTSEWIASALRPLFTPRLYRSKARTAGFLDPVVTLIKLLSRKDAVHWESPLSAAPTTPPTHPAESALSVIGAIAPILGLALCLLAATLSRRLLVFTLISFW